MTDVVAIFAAPALLAGLTALVCVSTTLAVSAIVVSAFSMGLFEAAGLPLAVPKLIGEYLAVLIFLKALVVRTLGDGEPFRFFGLEYLLAATAVAVVSWLVNGTSLLGFVFFIRFMAVYYLLFLAVANLRLTKPQIEFVFLVICTVFIVQIPVGWMKAVGYGIDEFWVGTVHMRAGTLSTLIPLVASAMLFALSLYRFRVIYLALMVGFLSFGIIGEKRALVFVLPVVLGACAAAFALRAWLSASQEARRAMFVKARTVLPALLVVLMVATYAAFRLIPSLNPEYQVGGSFAPGHVIDYALSYSTRTMTGSFNNAEIEDPAVQAGRLRLLYEVATGLAAQADLRTLVGHGPGQSLPSPHLGGPGFFFDTFGVRGTTSGLLHFLADIGFLGTLAFTAFLGAVGRMAWRGYRIVTSPAWQSVALGTLGAWFVWVFDFSIYSHTFMSTGILMPVFFVALGVLVRASGQEARLRVRWRPQAVGTWPRLETRIP